jgi:hypothetical protein
VNPRTVAVRDALTWLLRQHGPSTTAELEQVLPTRTEHDFLRNRPVVKKSRHELYGNLRALEKDGTIIGSREPDGIMWRLAPAAVDDSLSASFWSVVGQLTPDATSILRWMGEEL